MKGICLHTAGRIGGEPHLRLKVASIALLTLLAAASPACAYGSSVEDLVGSFSIGKSIKIGSSSECFSTRQGADPLTPPQSGRAMAGGQPPSLAGFVLWPQQVNASSPGTISMAAHIIDDQSVWAAEAVFWGPGGLEASALLESRTSGTVRDGIFEGQMILPSASESLNATGGWHLQNLTLVDGEGNRRILTEADLQGLGLPTVIEVN